MLSDQKIEELQFFFQGYEGQYLQQRYTIFVRCFILNELLLITKVTSGVSVFPCIDAIYALRPSNKSARPVRVRHKVKQRLAALFQIVSAVLLLLLNIGCDRY